MIEITKGTWRVSGRYVIAKQNEEDYIRICLILSSGVDTELIAFAPTLKQQRDNLLAAVEKFVEWNVKYPSTTIYGHSAIVRIAAELDKIAEQAKAAIAKCEA